MKSEEIKGPNINAPEIALEGFIRSNDISKKDLFKKKIDKGEFYFFKTKPTKLNTHELLEESSTINITKNSMEKINEMG